MTASAGAATWTSTATASPTARCRAPTTRRPPTSRAAQGNTGTQHTQSALTSGKRTSCGSSGSTRRLAGAGAGRCQGSRRRNHRHHQRAATMLAIIEALARLSEEGEAASYLRVQPAHQRCGEGVQPSTTRST